MSEHTKKPRTASLMLGLGAGLLAVGLSVGFALWLPAGWAPEDRRAVLEAGFFAIFVSLGLALVGTSFFFIRECWAERHNRDRERAAELARLTWRHEFALSASRIGVWDVDLNTDELIWDEQTRNLLGVSEVRPTYGEADWLKAMHPDDREGALHQVDAAVGRSGRFRHEYRVIHPSGQTRYIRDTASVYVGEDGARRLVGVVVDITADVERNRELEQRRVEAEAATVAKSRFLATMSHEIRTPMSGILGLLGLMLDGDLTAEQRERAVLALGSAERLLDILNDILDFSRLEAEQIRMKSEPVAIHDLVCEVAALMAAAAARKGVEFRVDIDPSVPNMVLIDALRLRQVLANLASNAIKFTEEGEILVAVRHDSVLGRLYVTVRDSGIGIAPEQLDRIFQDFVQADNSLTRKVGGTGLGLAISRQLVELMGGSLEVESTVGAGSTFSFSIRAQRVLDVVDPVIVRRGLDTSVEPMRILLAEDNQTNQYLIGVLLRTAGHAVEMVSNGRDAVNSVRDRRFDAVLMDVQMPEMDGIAATRAIRELPSPAGRVPIIALTANALAGDEEICLAAGMTDYLTKPLDVAALHAALMRVAQQSATARSSAGATRLR